MRKECRYRKEGKVYSEVEGAGGCVEVVGEGVERSC